MPRPIRQQLAMWAILSPRLIQIWLEVHLYPPGPEIVPPIGLGGNRCRLRCICYNQYWVSAIDRPTTYVMLYTVCICTLGVPYMAIRIRTCEVQLGQAAECNRVCPAGVKPQFWLESQAVEPRNVAQRVLTLGYWSQVMLPRKFFLALVIKMWRVFSLFRLRVDLDVEQISVSQ